jgi:hypothetical protein
MGVGAVGVNGIAGILSRMFGTAPVSLEVKSGIFMDGTGSGVIG